MPVLRDNATYILDKLAQRFEGNVGLWVHAKNKSKMENWLQVELCSILKPLRCDNQEIDIITDKQHNDLNKKNIDLLIKCKNTLYAEALELKVIVIGGPASQDIKSLLRDNECLRDLPEKFRFDKFDNTETTLACKGVLFLVFPSNDRGKNKSLEGEKGYLKDMEKGLGEYDSNGGEWFSKDINFNGGEPSIDGKLYLKLV